MGVGGGHFGRSMGGCANMRRVQVMSVTGGRWLGRSAVVSVCLSTAASVLAGCPAHCSATLVRAGCLPQSTTHCGLSGTFVFGGARRQAKHSRQPASSGRVARTRRSRRRALRSAYFCSPLPCARNTATASTSNRPLATVSGHGIPLLSRKAPPRARPAANEGKAQLVCSTPRAPTTRHAAAATVREECPPRSARQALLARAA